jgi:hypothetical protein
MIVSTTGHHQPVGVVLPPTSQNYTFVKKYATMVILEEVPIPGSKLKLDFFVPQLNMAIEVQGQQHTEFNPHFYKDKMAFRRAQLNDQAKKAWCKQHGLNFVELNYDGTDADWAEVL